VKKLKRKDNIGKTPIIDHIDKFGKVKNLSYITLYQITNKIMTTKDILNQLDEWIDNCENFPIEKKGKSSYINEGELRALYYMKNWILLNEQK